MIIKLSSDPIPHSPRVPTYPEGEIQFAKYPDGWHIVDNKGRYGVAHYRKRYQYFCQFGADGPFEFVSVRDLRSATRAEREQSGI